MSATSGGSLTLVGSCVFLLPEMAADKQGGEDMQPTLSPSLFDENGEHEQFDDFTAKPTLSPSEQTKPVVTFTADIVLAGLSSDLLDSSSIAAIVTATAQSMNISNSFVSFVRSTSEEISRRLGSQIGFLSTYTVTATTAVAVPLINYATDTDATALYTSLSNKLTTATESTMFVDYLTAASTANGATQTANVASAAAIVSQETIVQPPSVSPAPLTETPSQQPSVVVTAQPSVQGVPTHQPTPFWFHLPGTPSPTPIPNDVEFEGHSVQCFEDCLGFVGVSRFGTYINETCEFLAPLFNEYTAATEDFHMSATTLGLII
eukprot:gene39747-49121_t